MNLASLSIHRPVLAIVMSLVIVIFGFIGFQRLGIREFPLADPPIITVNTVYVGAGAEVIETQITEVLEESINGIDGIRTLSSTSSDGRSNITIEFNLGKDMEEAANDVRERVSRAQRNLPSDCDPPVVTKQDAASEFVIFTQITSEKRNLLELTEIAYNVVKERLQTVEGVSDVQVWGEKRYAMRLWLNPQKLQAYQVTLSDIQRAVQTENIELPAGRLEGSSTEIGLKTMGRLNNPEDYNQLIIKQSNGQNVRLRDVGYAIIEPEDLRGILKRDMKPMIGIPVFARQGANTVAMANEIYKRFEQIKKDLPPDVQAYIAVDNTKYVKASIAEVQETAFIAFVLVILIIFIFLRDWRSTLIPVIAIPISLVGSFFIMYAAGFTINVLTMLGIVLSIGLVVDDAIVVLENIYTKIESGIAPIEAAIQGSKEIFFAVVSTTVVLAAVFLPVIFLEGLTGRLFREFGIVVAGSVIISSFVALTLTPMMCSRMLKIGHVNRFYKATEPFFLAFENAYRISLGKFLNKKWLAIAVLAACVVTILLMIKLLPSELAPLEDRSSLRVSLTAPEATTSELMINYMDELNQMLNDSMGNYKEAIIYVLAPGRISSGANSGFFRVVLVPPHERPYSQMDLAQKITQWFKGISTVKSFVLQEQTIGDKRAGLPVQFVIQAPDLQQLKQILPDFLEQVSKDSTFSVYDVNLKFTRPEIEIYINREKARALGVSVADVAQTLQLAYSGNRLGYFLKNSKQYQIIGQMEKSYRDKPSDLLDLMVKNQKGDFIPIANIIDIQEKASPPQLFRYSRFVSATVSAGLAPGKAMSDGIQAMENIKNKVLDERFYTALSGPSKDFVESSSSIIFSFALALILIYLILAAQFESFKYPVIILLTVPMALAGALLSLWYFNQSLNLFSQIGIIMLIGLVTKNGILIIEFAQQKRTLHSLDAYRAIVEASVARFRPILMTNLATILGFLPIALALGAGAESRVSMGIAVIGGLLLSGFLTLFVIPVMYLLFQLKVKFSPVSVKVIFVLFLSSISIYNARAENLSLQQAIDRALKYNYDLQMAKAEAENARLFTTREAAGYMPIVSLSANTNNSAFINTEQKFANNTTQIRNNVTSNQITAGPVATWTLFNGLLNKSQWEIAQKQWELQQLKVEQIEQKVIYDVCKQYYAIVYQNRLFKATLNSLNLQKLKLKTAESRYQSGGGSKSDWLQAKIDVNQIQHNLMQIEVDKKAAKNTLLTTLCLPPYADIEIIEDSVFFLNQESAIDLALQFESKNTDIKMAIKSKEAAKLKISIEMANKFPVLQLNAGYNFLYARSGAGFLISNETRNFIYGATFAWPIYNGNLAARRVQSSRILAKNADIAVKRSQLQVNLQLQLFVQAYHTKLKQIDIEEENLTLVNENIALALTRYNQGVITVYELRQVEQSFVDVQTKYAQTQLLTKYAELDLLFASGQIKQVYGGY